MQVIICLNPFMLCMEELLYDFFLDFKSFFHVDASPDNVILEHEDQSHPVLLTQENAVNVKSTDMHEVEGDKGVHGSVQMDVSERRGSSSLHVNFLCSELGKDVVATGDHKYIEPNPHSRSRTYKDDVEQKNTALPNGNGILTAQTIESARSAGAESSAAVSMKDNLGGKTTALYYSEEKKKQSLQNEDFKLNETRCGEVGFIYRITYVL